MLLILLEMSSLLRNHELFSFLHKHIAADKKEVNFTGMGGEMNGKWSIPNEDYPKFFDLLHNYLWVNNGAPMNMVERPRKNESKPLMIDIDFHYSLETSKIRRSFR